MNRIYQRLLRETRLCLVSAFPSATPEQVASQFVKFSREFDNVEIIDMEPSEMLKRRTEPACWSDRIRRHPEPRAVGHRRPCLRSHDALGGSRHVDTSASGLEGAYAAVPEGWLLSINR